MDADNSVTQCRGTDEDVIGSARETQPPRLRHSLIDVLMPANPPEPKNARVVRLFDCEGAVKDAPPATLQPAPRQPTPREAAKAARRLSLFAAAGLD